MTSEQFDAVIVGAGFAGIGAAIQLKRLGYDELRDPRARGRPGRHLARQPLPRAGRRRPHHHLLLLLRAEPELVAAVHSGHRRSSSTPTTSPTSTTCAATCGSTPPSRARAGTRTPSVWRVALAGGETLTARYLITATGFLSQPKMPDIPGIDELRGQGHPHHRLGRRLRPRRTAGSPSSAPAPPPSSSSPSWPRRPPTSPCTSAPRSGWCPRSTCGSRERAKRLFARVPLTSAPSAG